MVQQMPGGEVIDYPFPSAQTNNFLIKERTAAAQASSPQRNP
jgi:hypothetical protein